jgi:peptidoglycan/LPS O-acetylase OafA/YrhL
MIQRNQSLDVLRGIAVLLVIAYHYPYFSFSRIAWIGVDLFFVLSGFLISGLLFAEIQRTGSIRIGRFLLRRGFKIYPAFYFYILFTALAFPSLREDLWREVLFLQNYGAQIGGFWTHTWSLAVEEHFYLVLPMVLLVLHRFGKLAWLPAISITLAASCFVMRVEHSLATNMSPAFSTHLRIDALFAGVTLGYIYHFRRDKFLSHWWFAPAAGLLLLPTVFMRASAVSYSLALTANTLAFSLLVLWSVTREFRGVGWLAEVGRYSYSIYLWHLLVFVFWHGNEGASLIGFIGYTCTSIAIGTAMAVMIEFPFLQLREWVCSNAKAKRTHFYEGIVRRKTVFDSSDLVSVNHKKSTGIAITHGRTANRPMIAGAANTNMAAEPEMALDSLGER